MELLVGDAHKKNLQKKSMELSNKNSDWKEIKNQCIPRENFFFKLAELYGRKVSKIIFGSNP